MTDTDIDMCRAHWAWTWTRDGLDAPSSSPSSLNPPDHHFGPRSFDEDVIDWEGGGKEGWRVGKDVGGWKAREKMAQEGVQIEKGNLRTNPEGIGKITKKRPPVGAAGGYARLRPQGPRPQCGSATSDCSSAGGGIGDGDGSGYDDGRDADRDGDGGGRRGSGSSVGTDRNVPRQPPCLLLLPPPCARAGTRRGVHAYRASRYRRGDKGSPDKHSRPR